MNMKVMELMRIHFRPEYLNRLDEIIVFHSLTKDDIIAIVKLQADMVAERVREGAGISLSFSDAVINRIADEAYDPAYGARPVKRYIQREIENTLASELLTRQLPKQVSVELKKRQDCHCLIVVITPLPDGEFS